MVPNYYSLILLLTMLRILPFGESARLCLVPDGGRSNTLPASEIGDASWGACVIKGTRVKRVSRENTPRFSGHWK